MTAPRGFARLALAALLAAAAGGSLVRAQTMQTVSFDQAIARAIERNPTIAIAATAIARAQVLVQETRSALMPFASVNVANVTIDNARSFGGTVTQPQNQFFVSPSVSMTVLSLWQRSVINQAKDQMEVANRSTAETRQAVAVATAEAYLAVIASRRELDVDLRALDAARAHLSYADKRLEGGVGSRLNQLRAAQEVEITDARVEAVRILLRRAQEALGVLLAVDGPVDAAAEPVFEVPSSIQESEWAVARPDLQLQAAIRRSSERVIKDAFKDWLPEATVAFNPQFVGPAGAFQPANTWRLTLSVTQPLFKGGLSRNFDARLADVTLTQANLADAQIRMQARSEIRMAQEALAGSERALVSSQRASDHAAEVLKITTTAFEVGATTNIEVIDAQRSARDSASAAALAEDAVRRAKLDLLVALGKFPK
jgi:outer membrane protein TolC